MTAVAGTGAPIQRRRALLIFAALSVAAAVVYLYAGRGTAPFFDEWTWITLRRGLSAHTLLDPHNGHLSVIPVLIQKVLLAIAGLQHYWLFRLVPLALHLLCSYFVFRFVDVRVGPLAAVLGAFLVLALGSGSEDVIWGFQTGFMLSVTFGVLALSALASSQARSGIVAMAALAIALGSSGIGLVFLFAAIVFVALDGQKNKRIAVLIPLLCYAAWYVGFARGSGQAQASNLPLVIDFATSMGSAAFGGLTGFGLDIGRILLVLAVIVVLRHLARVPRVSPMVVALLLAPIFLWILTGLSRAQLGEPGAGRYIYPGAVLIVLAGAELLRGYRPTTRHLAIGAMVAIAFGLANVDELRTESRTLRGDAFTLKAQIGALELVQSQVDPGFQPAPAVAPQINAGGYAGAEHAFGPLVDNPEATITSSYSADRAAADDTLARAGEVATHGVRTVGSGTTPIAVASTGRSGATLTTRAACTTTDPDTVRSVITLAPGAAAVVAGAQPATLDLRRFGDAFGAGARALPAIPVEIRVAKDASSRPWQIQIAGGGRVRICSA